MVMFEENVIPYTFYFVVGDMQAHLMPVSILRIKNEIEFEEKNTVYRAIFKYRMARHIKKNSPQQNKLLYFLLCLSL